MRLDEYRNDVDKVKIEVLVAALRSGEYQQGMNCLRPLGSETYCCLGLATELVPGVTWVVDKNHNIDGFTPMLNSVPGQGYYMPMFAQEYYGFPEHEANFLVILTPDERKRMESRSILRGDTAHVGSLNDEGFTFAEIADAIERTYLNDEVYNQWLKDYPVPNTAWKSSLWSSQP